MADHYCELPVASGDDAPGAVVLLSGGLDSATLLYLVRSLGFFPHALSFRYGQRHKVELEAAAVLAARLPVKRHLVVDLRLDDFGGSALTSALPVPKSGVVPDAIPITYVPARNTVFLSLALAWAEALGIHDLFIGVNAVDYSGYPDCRPEFIAAFERMANLGTRDGVTGRPFRVHAPLLRLNKGEIIARGLELGVDFGVTRSCYDPDGAGRGCGECDSCRLRLAGFAAVGVGDPAPYRG